ncbi:MAG: hypothetical protein H6733_15365 [Alphaproteobacteria bacterium]|nr:hypothetical protein [Alphaproteobacteria bacterium]
MPTLLLLLAVPGALAWPGDDAWVDLVRDGTPLVDADDGLDALDVVGRAAWSADDRWWYLRLPLAADPAPGGTWTEGAWGALLDLDADGAVEAWLGVTGTGGDVVVAVPDGDGTDLRLIGTWTVTLTIDAAQTRTVDLGEGRVALDLAVRRTVLASEAGVGASTPVRWLVATASDATLASWADLFGCADLACPAVVTTAADVVAIDADEDGLTLPVERRAGTDPLVADSDLGGLADGFEDRDHDGVIGPWETDPLDPSDDADADGDTIPDVVEKGPGGEDVHSDGDGRPDHEDSDSDGDGLSDAVEGVADPDGDGIPAYRDPDSDGDGIPDAQDGVLDPDDDGLPAFLDTDSDDDGIPDAVEGSKDFDRDGTPNHVDTDADGDGVPDAEEGTADVDCDGRPDFLDDDPLDGFCDTDLPRGDVDDAPFDGLPAPIVPASADDLPGCATTGGAPGSLGWLALSGLALVGVRRRRCR